MDIQPARATLENLMFAQILEPAFGCSSPIGAFETQSFAALVVREIEHRRG